MVGARATSRARAAAPARPAAKRVRRTTGSMGSLLGWGWQRGPLRAPVGNARDRGEHGGGREDLRQHDGDGVSLARKNEVEGHAAAAMLLQKAGDLGIAAGPV